MNNSLFSLAVSKGELAVEINLIPANRLVAAELNLSPANRWLAAKHNRFASFFNFKETRSREKRKTSFGV